MQVKFKNLIMGYTGKADGSVIYFSPKLQKFLLRRAPHGKRHSGQSRFAEIQKRIFSLQPSEAFKDDIKTYLPLYNALKANLDKPILSWNYLYSKMMWSMHHICKVDLASIEREDLADLPCQSLAAAINAGLLPKVKGWHSYTGQI
ncbi:MAG: hypothetical protein RBR69_09510 [Candidatus Cloacimonadaceae bacterium]|jgi:hypothetical protein|nr:hypothetical protein [Candidatus Cloacimonadota bacterium]MDY0128353.1 hypothetical protein [Candidatus Cloacimonadaceae bacterium]MCB5254452.1 hypothetical protein [Candidatus Cloacimonadota bacterium]MCK9243353.1 hypothetical protein [Candidatus Cloacimonadota bacterium]MDD3103843.1 hypothetical protein [Candidatus Cloacimonadota bacterium]